MFNTIDLVSYANDKDKDTVNLSANANINIGEQAAVEISKGISNFGSNIGLGATVAGVSAAVAKGISNSSIPPVQKAGIILAGSAVGGAIHVAASAINRNNSYNSQSSVNKSLDNTNNLIDLGNNVSPLEVLLQCVNILADASLFLLCILCLQLFYKFYLSDRPQLK